MNLVDSVNLATKWYVVGGLIFMALWQIVLVVLRALGHPVNLISMTMKDLGYGGMAAAVWYVSGLPFHWWVTWRKPVWSTPWPAFSWWAIGVVLLVVGLVWGQHLHERPTRWSLVLWPPVLAPTSALYSWAFFPQSVPNWTPAWLPAFLR